MQTCGHRALRTQHFVLHGQPPDIVQLASFVHVAKYMPLAMLVQGRLQLPPAVVAEQFQDCCARLGKLVPLIAVGGCVGHCFTAGKR
jgi:hypothetical protein